MQIKGLWKYPRAPTAGLFFQDERATPAVLTFLRDIEVGRVVTLAPREEEWEVLEGIELWPEEVEGRAENGDERGPGPAPP